MIPVRNYRPPMRTRLRLRFGGLWKRNHPDLPSLPEIAMMIAFVFGVLVLQGILERKAIAAEAAEKRADQAERTVVECLNGIAIWKAEDGSEVGCMPAQSNG